MYFWVTDSTVMKNTLFAFICLLLVASCNSPHANDLNRAELIMDDQPDSALLILSRIKTPLPTKKQEAKYALLLSQAYDKNYIDLTTDSLISLAVDYYKMHGPLEDRMKAWFYLGRIQKNARDYTKAIVSLTKAAGLAHQISNYYFSGMANQNISNLFCDTYNKSEAVNYASQAVDDFTAAGKESHKNYAILTLAISYFNAGDPERAEDLLRSLIDSCRNPILIEECQRNLGSALMAKKGNTDAKEAVECFRIGGIDNLDITDLGCYATALNMEGLHDSAYFYLRKAYENSTTAADSANVAFHHYRIASANGDYEEACVQLWESTQAQDSLIRLALKESMTSTLKNYYQEESLLEKERLKNQRYRNAFSIGCLLLALALVVLFFVTRAKKERKRVQLQMDMLQNDNLRIQQANASLMGSLFQERFSILEKLSNNYFQEEDGAKKSLVFKEFSKYLKALQSDGEVFRNLEEDLDRYCNGIVSKFKAQVPEIKGDNLKICELFFAGMSYEKVLAIMNRQSTGSLRTLKSRLRSIIKDSGVEDSVLFLQYLDGDKESGRSSKNS